MMVQCTTCDRTVPAVPVVVGVWPEVPVSCAHVREDGSKCEEGAMRYRNREEQEEMLGEMLRSPEFEPAASNGMRW